MPRAAWYEPHDLHRRVPTAVAPGVTLGLAQRPQPSHSPRLGATPDGRSNPFERSHGQTVATQLIPVQLGELLVSRPHDGAPARVDLVGQRHSPVVGDLR